MRLGARVVKAAVTVAGVGALGNLGGMIIVRVLQAKRVPRLPEQVVLSMDLTDTQITETADLYEISLHLPKASTAPQQQQVYAQPTGQLAFTGMSTSILFL
ncbi:hypothetical protein WJX77_006805 [Trebouxia sp. C0004]